MSSQIDNEKIEQIVTYFRGGLDQGYNIHNAIRSAIEEVDLVPREQVDQETDVFERANQMWAEWGRRKRSEIRDLRKLLQQAQEDRYHLGGRVAHAEAQLRQRDERIEELEGAMRSVLRWADGELASKGRESIPVEEARNALTTPPASGGEDDPDDPPGGPFSEHVRRKVQRATAGERDEDGAEIVDDVTGAVLRPSDPQPHQYDGQPDTDVGEAVYKCLALLTARAIMGGMDSETAYSCSNQVRRHLARECAPDAVWHEANNAVELLEAIWNDGGLSENEWPDLRSCLLRSSHLKRALADSGQGGTNDG